MKHIRIIGYPDLHDRLLGDKARNHIKALSLALVFSRWLFVLLVTQTVFVSGCTSALWDKNTFAHYYRPADPNNLRLFCSKERKDILVQYDESSETDNGTRPRYYWLEPNTIRINAERKPHFASAKAIEGLIPIPVTETPSSYIPTGLIELYAVARYDDYVFTLYAGMEQLDPYQLPRYIGASRRVKQVLLTPFAVAVDATIIGAVVCYEAAPSLGYYLNRQRPLERQHVAQEVTEANRRSR
jgi:hypothetical protein